MSSDDNYIDFDQLFGKHEGDKGYFERNRENPDAIYLDERENAIDSLETALQFLDRNDNLKWKWFAFAIHHSIYSFCVAALENGNYENVLMRDWEDDNNLYVQKGQDVQIKKSKISYFHIKNYKTSAYRIQWTDVSSIPLEKKSKKQRSFREKLISFWTALARVQDSYFWMGRLYGQKPLIISDEELTRIVWLSDAVRNDLIPFIPKSYAIGIIDIIEATRVVLYKIDFLVFESFSILFVDYEQSQRRIRDAIDKIIAKLDSEEVIINNTLR
jgi:hypothetical protein